MSETYDITKKGIPISTKGLILKDREGHTGEDMNVLVGIKYKKHLRKEDGQKILKQKEE